MPGLTTPKGGATQQTTQQQQVPAYVQSAQQGLLNQSNNILGPYLQQQNYTQAPLNADQTGAYDLTRSLAQSAFTGGGSQPQGTTGGGFDAAAYYAANPDVAHDGTYGAGGSKGAYQHYLDYGQAEGRAQTLTPVTTLPLTGAQQALQNATNRAIAGSGITSPTLMDFTQNQGIWQAPTTAAQATTRDATSQGYTAQGYNAQGYGAQNAAAQGYTAQNATAQGYDPTKSTAEQVSAGEIQQFLNPYTQSVVDTTLAQMARTRDETAAKNNARAAAAGSFGGSRQALQSAQLDRSFGEQSAQTIATLMSAGYDKATATALANASMRQQTGQANQQAANTAAQFGASAQNTAALTNAAAQNTASQFGASAQNTANLTNAAAQNAAAQFGANAQNTAAQFGANANNTAAQFGAQAANSASLANSAASNAASQFNAGAQNSRDAQNAQTGAALLQANNQNQLSRYSTDVSRYSAENAQANAAVQLQEAVRSGDQNRMLQAIQALTSAGNAQQQYAQSNISLPLQYLQLLGQLTPQNYGQTTTTTAPNNAPSPLQTIIGGVGTALTSTIPGGSILGGLLK